MKAIIALQHENAKTKCALCDKKYASANIGWREGLRGQRRAETELGGDHEASANIVFGLALLIGLEQHRIAGMALQFLFALDGVFKHA